MENEGIMSSGAEVTLEDIQKQVKKISDNSFVAFFQKIWRNWLSVWYGFSDKHPKFSKLLYQIVFFVIFSVGVTLFQYLVTLFLPMMFGIGLAGTDFMWPKIPLYEIDGVQKYWNLLGYDISYKNGAVIIGGGLGYFIAFEIATFLAQVINFPLQRNITFRSHGKVGWQIMWYFIGWVLTSLFCNAINSLWLPIGAAYLPFAVYNILSMISMGGISMIIFFFIFLVIFPDYNVATKRATAKLEKLKKSNADAEKIKKVKLTLDDVSKKAKLSNAEKAEAKAITQASTSAMKYFAVIKNSDKAKAKVSTLEQAADVSKKDELAALKSEVTAFEEKIEKSRKEAIAAIVNKNEEILKRQTVIKECAVQA